MRWPTGSRRTATRRPRSSSTSGICRDDPVGELAAEAHLGAGLVQLRALGQPTAAYQHLVEVFDLDPEPDTAAYARQALAEIAALQKFRPS